MLSAHLTCASSCSRSWQSYPSPAVPVTPSLCPDLPPHSQLVLSCTSRKLPRICSLCGVRRGQQVSLSLPVSGLPAHRASLSTVLELQAGSLPWLPGWECSRDPRERTGPVFTLSASCCTHTQGQPSLCSPHSRAQGTGNVSAGLGWSRACPSELAAAAVIPPALSGRGGSALLGNREESKILKFTSVPFFFPLSVKSLHLG